MVSPNLNAVRVSAGNSRYVAGAGVAEGEADRAVLFLEQFETEQFAYFKSDKCRDLDHHLGDIHSYILGEQAFGPVKAPLTSLLHLADKEIEICEPPQHCQKHQESYC